MNIGKIRVDKKIYKNLNFFRFYLKGILNNMKKIFVFLFTLLVLLTSIIWWHQPPNSVTVWSINQIDETSFSLDVVEEISSLLKKVDVLNFQKNKTHMAWAAKLQAILLRYKDKDDEYLKEFEKELNCYISESKEQADAISIFFNCIDKEKCYNLRKSLNSEPLSANEILVDFLKEQGDEELIKIFNHYVPLQLNKILEWAQKQLEQLGWIKKQNEKQIGRASCRERV